MIPENMPNPFTPGRTASRPMPPLQYAAYASRSEFVLISNISY